MTRRVSWVLLSSAMALWITSCGLLPPTASRSPSIPVNTGDVGAFFTISEVGLGDNGWVTLTNFTDQPANIGGAFVCQASACVDLPDAVVEPGRSVRVGVGTGEGLGDLLIREAPLDLAASDGEVAIYASGDPANGQAIRAYLEWGSTPHALTPDAVAAGLWLDGSYAPSGPGATRLFQDENGLWLWE